MMLSVSGFASGQGSAWTGVHHPGLRLGILTRPPCDVLPAMWSVHLPVNLIT